jgi:hypothetical protein
MVREEVEKFEDRKLSQIAKKRDKTRGRSLIKHDDFWEWRFRTKKTRNSGAKRPDFPVHEDQVFRSKKTNLSTFSGFGCMTA